MAITIESNTVSKIPVSYDSESHSVFQDMAITILGDSVLEKEQLVYTDDEDLIPTTHVIEQYVVRDRCANMVASTSWSIFLFCSLLLFGLVRSLFNAFSRGSD